MQADTSLKMKYKRQYPLHLHVAFCYVTCAWTEMHIPKDQMHIPKDQMQSQQANLHLVMGV